MQTNTNVNAVRIYAAFGTHIESGFFFCFFIAESVSQEVQLSILSFSSFSLSATTLGTNWLSLMKSPAMMLREPTLEPGLCSRTQASRAG